MLSFWVGRGVAYRGGGSASSALAFDKARSKAAFAAAGVPTPAYQILELGEMGAEGLRMGLPLVMKPLCEGSSVGVPGGFGSVWGVGAGGVVY